MPKPYTMDMTRFWPFGHYNKNGKVIPSNVPYYGESYPARLYEYSHFPYTYAYDVPGVITYPRSLYGRGFGSMSEYGHRTPYRSELFGYKYPPYLTTDEVEYYRDMQYPRYSRYRPCKHERCFKFSYAI